MPFPSLGKHVERLLLEGENADYPQILQRALFRAGAEIAGQKGLDLPEEFGQKHSNLLGKIGLTATNLGPAYEAYLGLLPKIEEDRVVWTRNLDARRHKGIYYTPPKIVQEVLRYALPDSSAIPTVCDITCGAGAFLLSAAKRISAVSDLPLSETVRRCIFGVDIDPIAVQICRLSLWLESGCLLSESNLRTADSLLSDWTQLFPEIAHAGGFDAVVGNPPFGGVVEGRVPQAVSESRKDRFPDLTGTADHSSYFLSIALRAAKPGGRVSLVMPRSFLSAHASAQLRQPDRWSLTLKRRLTEHSAFTGASVHVCIVGFEARSSNEQRQNLQKVSVLKSLEVTASLTVSEAYEIAGHVHEGVSSDAFKLLTSGLIDPCAAKWGVKPCRFLKKDYKQPCLEATSVPPKRRLQASRPKLVIAGLSMTLEGLLDVSGEFVGSVGTYTITHLSDNVESLSRALQHLHSEQVQTKFRRELGASALGGGNITVTKRFLQSVLASAGF